MSTPTVPFDSKFVSLIRRVLSAAENGGVEWNPSSVAIFADDNRFTTPRKQVTLSVGFTEGGGNLKKVPEHYIDKGGSFAPYLATMGSGPTLASDPKLIKALKETGKQPAMVEAQHECFEELYLELAFKWAKRHGVTLHSRSWSSPIPFFILAKCLTVGWRNSRRSNPKTAGMNGPGFTVISQPRHEWLATHLIRVLRNTVYRVKCYRAEIARDNWMLDILPIDMNDTPVAHVA